MRLRELARRLGATLEGNGDVDIRGIAPVESAREDEVTFLANPRYRAQLAQSNAGAVILGHGEQSSGTPVLRVAEPYEVFVRALRIFDQRRTPGPGVHPTAVIAATAQVGAGAYVGPYVVIGEDVVVGRDARLHPHVTIYPDVRIGDRFTAHAGVVVREHVSIGDDVTLQPGVVLGGDGFGFLPQKDPVPLSIPQLGSVAVGSAVDIGANATVDRATVGVTRLGNGVKLDNLVMIAHGCEVGDGSLIAAQFGMAGSSKLGRHVMAGGQSGVSGHLCVGDHARIAAQSGIARDVAPGETVGGSPAMPIGLWRRCSLLLRDLPTFVRLLRMLDERTGSNSGTDVSTSNDPPRR